MELLIIGGGEEQSNLEHQVTTLPSKVKLWPLKRQHYFFSGRLDRYTRSQMARDCAWFCTRSAMSHCIQHESHGPEIEYLSNDVRAMPLCDEEEFSRSIGSIFIHQ